MKPINELESIEHYKEKLLKCSKSDNESIHGCYDDYIKAIAFKYEPKLVEEADKIVRDIDFWFA